MNEEIILNLWYVVDDHGMIYSLRARCYICTGIDEDKLAMLRRFAVSDYQIAQMFPIPDRFHTTIVEGDTKRKLAVVGLDSLEATGGVMMLFEDVLVALENSLPTTTKLSIGREPLVCITPLIADDNNQLTPKTSPRKAL
ncbi:MAG TPA: hypothetical protein VGF44_04665 [Terriglobales bacterium]|jgi:hypothetical protein